MRGLAAVLAVVPAMAAAEGDAGRGAALFDAFCAACHGDDARGAGPMAEVLNVAPPDLTALGAANGGVFPMFRVVRQIDGRDPLLAHGGEMPLFGHLFEFPDAAIASETGQPIVTAQPIADIAAFLAIIQK